MNWTNLNHTGIQVGLHEYIEDYREYAELFGVVKGWSIEFYSYAVSSNQLKALPHILWKCFVGEFWTNNFKKMLMARIRLA